MALTSYDSEADFLIKASKIGLFLPFEKSQLSDVKLSHFQKRHYRIRLASIQDINELMSIEKQCWSPSLQSSEHHIRQRIIQFPKGNLLIEIKDRIVGSIYSQRINDISDITNKNCDNILSCHLDDGKYIQLLSINVLSEYGYQGLGDQLLSFMLNYARKISGICGVVAVSLCKDYSKYKNISIQEYVEKRDEDNFLIDPILRFHECHEGKVSGLIKNYRQYLH